MLEHIEEIFDEIGPITKDDYGRLTCRSTLSAHKQETSTVSILLGPRTQDDYVRRIYSSTVSTDKQNIHPGLSIE